MKWSIVNKFKKLNILFTIYFFLIISFLGTLVGIYLNYSESKNSLGINLNNLKENSIHVDNDIYDLLNRKIFIANNTGNIVSDFLLQDGLSESTDSNNDDFSSAIVLTDLEPLDKKILNNSKTLWKALYNNVLNNFNNFWFISRSNFARISPGELVQNISKDNNFLNNFYYEAVTPENNPERKPLWTPVYYDDLLKTWVVSYILPVYIENIFYGVVGFDLYLESLINEIKNSVKKIGSLEVIIYDLNKDIIFKQDYFNDADAMKFIDKLNNKVGETTSFKIGNEFYHIINYEMDFMKWRIAYYFRESDILNDPVDATITIFILVVVVTLITAFLSWFVIRWAIIKPINTLSLAASYFDFGTNVEEIALRNDEIGSLTKSFITMGKTITKQIKEIETENSEKLETEKKFRRLVENLGKEYFFFAYTTSGNFTYVGDSVKEMLGYEPKEFMDNYESYLTNSEFNNIRRVKVQAAIKGHKQDPYNIEVYTKEGNIKLLEIVETPILDKSNNVISIEGVSHDITEIKKSELELKRHKENLEEIVTERTKELENTLIELVETKKMASLGELVSGVAHEINTPVGIGVTASTHMTDLITNFQELFLTNKLSKNKFEVFIKEINETSKIIYTNMRKAASLIKGFKEIAVDQTSEDIRTFEIKEYIDEILLSLHSEIKHTKHKILVDCPENLKLTTFPGAISQILTNLIFNSLIHGFENMESGTVSIELQKLNSNIQVKYSDNGNGIDQHILDKIYEPFFTTKRESGGSGLGMNIVLNLVQKTLKGSIKCSSIIGQGVEFLIEFPREIGEVI